MAVRVTILDPETGEGNDIVKVYGDELCIEGAIPRIWFGDNEVTDPEPQWGGTPYWISFHIPNGTGVVDVTADWEDGNSYVLYDGFTYV